MIETVISKIDQLVKEIYTVDQNKVNVYYLEFIDAIGAFLQDMMDKGYTVDLREDLEKIQRGMEIKDYIYVSDIIKYELRKDFEELKKSMS
ncbi:MAG: hypothetical protein II992_00295 [Lachnospiraceae bacterium]|nr:hypothetical protein [Lachnospiraceae bacterium]